MSFKIVGVLSLVILTVLIVAPRKTAVTSASSNLNCTNSTTPVFNPYPLSDTPGGCNDYAFIRARVDKADGSQTAFSAGSIQAQAGDKVEVVLYIDNGAALGSDSLTNLRLSTSADLSAGSSHSVSASVTASNVPSSLSGSLGIATPGGASLQVDPKSGQWFEDQSYMGSFGNIVNTNTQLPDQAACFTHVRFIYIIFNVVGSVVRNPSGHISGSVGGQVGSQCLFNGNLQWTVQNVQDAEVFVLDPDTHTENVFAHNLPGQNNPGTGNAPWIQPNKDYIFRLYSLDNGKVLLDSVTLRTNQTCGQAPTPTVTLSVSNFCVNATPNYVVTGSKDLAGLQIVWSSNHGGESNDYYNQSLDGNGFWSGPGNRAWTTSDVGSWTKTVSVLKNGQLVATSVAFPFTVSNCGGGPTTLSCSANVASANINDNVQFTATGGSSAYSWATSNNANAGSGTVFNVYFQTAGDKTVTVTSGGQTATCGVHINGPVAPNSTVALTVANFCVGQIPVYTVQASTDAGGQQIYWSSTLNGASTGEVNANYSQILNSNGYWSGPGNRAWTTNDIGSWTKTVGVLRNGQASATSAAFPFTVSNCGGGATSLTCAANVSSANVGDYVLFSAQGGSSSYTWATSNNSNAGTGSLFNVYFQSAGNKTVTVTSGGQTATCGVYINASSTYTATTTPAYYNYNNTNNNCVNYSCNNTYTNTNTTYSNPPVYYQPPVYYNNNPQPIYTYSAPPAPAVLGGNVSLSYSKSAVNETKNADATSVIASKEDFITYTLTVSNNGNTPSTNFVITDDLSQVLQFADMVDNGGGNLVGNTLSYAGITVPAGGSVSRSFKVRIKFTLGDNLSYTMSNTYGNTIVIHINKPQVLGAFIAPKTGADTNAIIFATLLTGATAIVKKRKTIFKLIFT